MIFSVLICTYNRHDMLDKALRSIVVDTMVKPNEVVIVNGGGVEADRIVGKYIGVNEVDVRLVKVVNINLANSRNIGLEECRGEIIAMTDDDAEVFPDWVQRMVDVHRSHPEAGAVGGLVLGTNTDSLVGRVADLITFPSWPEAQEVRTLPGVNISYKRAVLELVGQQDKELFRGEDVDFNWRVIRLGRTIRFDPSIKVYHTHRPTMRGFVGQHYMYGRAYVLVRRKWPDMYCIYPRGIRSLKDILKGGHFFIGGLYQPLVQAKALETVGLKIRALPVLYLAALAWRWGMIRQGLFA